MIRFFLLFLIVFLATPSIASDQVWVRIDTNDKTLQVLQGEEILDSFENIAIGRRGAGFKAHRGDDITPLGTYKIRWINRNSMFKIFFGFDYPSMDNAQKAFDDGLISVDTFNKIVRAHSKNKVPPQNTAMGGMLGIHGLGNANKYVHGEFDWTHGCIAMTNPQIERFSRWVSNGTVVKVK